jgi:hypothetical protein
MIQRFKRLRNDAGSHVLSFFSFSSFSSFSSFVQRFFSFSILNSQFSILLAVLLVSCGKDRRLPDEELLLRGGTDQLFYDIKILDPYVLLLNDAGDTALYVYDMNDMTKPRLSGLRKTNGGAWTSPEFAKSDTFREEGCRKTVLIDGKSFVREIAFDDRAEQLRITSRPLPAGLVGSTGYNFTRSDILGVPVMDTAGKLFYFFSGNDYYWVPRPPVDGRPLKAYDISFNHLCVNEEKNSIVAALQYVNQILFYDMDGRLKSTFTAGDRPVLPHDGKNRFDAGNAEKYFIDIYGTPEYVYCLYDGTRHYTGISDIYIFTWSGKHVATLKTGRNLKKIAADRHNSCILAIAANDRGGRDLIRFRN